MDARISMATSVGGEGDPNPSSNSRETHYWLRTVQGYNIELFQRCFLKGPESLVHNFSPWAHGAR